MHRRVVITGVGMITPVGNDVNTSWNAAVEGKSGIDYITAFDTTNFTTKIAGEVKGINFENYIDKKEMRRMDRFTHFAVASAKMAMEDSKLDITKIDNDKFGVIIGCGVGGLGTMEEQHEKLLSAGPSRVSPFYIPMQIIDISSGYISMIYNAKGPNYCTVSACASGSHAIGDSFRMIKHGYADIMITGGSEAPVRPMAVAGFTNMKALSGRNDDPKKASRPFDGERDGFVMGEGAGLLILESLEHAVARGAKIYAEIVGCGMTADAFHITQPAPQGEGAARAMKSAIQEAGITPEKIDYINAHGTSTPYNDKCETEAIKGTFEKHAYKLLISSTKSVTGHLLGAAGGVEAVFAALALHHGVVPPTINQEKADPDCDLCYVPNVAIKREINYALSNSLGFGGHNISICFKKY